MGISRLWVVALAAVSLCSATAMAATLGGKLELDDEGSFFVNGRSVRSEYPGASLRTGPAPPGDIVVNQMYVHYRIPSRRSGPTIVMVHGSNHTGMTYETTPDGREGWATWFVRIMGNSHMMMMDRNNLQVAGVLRKWIGENVK